MYAIRPPRISSPSILGSERKRRIPVTPGQKNRLFADAGAKCSKCKRSLKGLRPHVHHISGNPADGRQSNLILLCPNCHSKSHDYKKVKRRDWLGNTYTVTKMVVKGAKKRKRSATKKRRARRNNKPFGFEPIRVRPPKLW